MPLIQTKPLPSFERLKAEGQPIIDLKRAESQDIRPIHIGILNLMPDAALEATERQFLRLIGNSSLVAQINSHIFTLPFIRRGKDAQKHIDMYYESFDDVKKHGLDALIVTGANEETNPRLDDTEFWAPLYDALEWSQHHVSSTLCSCLSGHAAVSHLFGELPSFQDKKFWGIFDHHLTDPQHPLCNAMNTLFHAPHSRYSLLKRDQFERAGMHVLAENEKGGVHIAVSADGINLVCLQGHPEYDTFSILKEYKREILSFVNGERDDYPPVPENYFRPQAHAIALEYQDKVLYAVSNNDDIPEFPEKLLEERLLNTWRDSAKSFMNNWIGLVYQTTHFDISKQYMDDIDPDDPLDLKRGR